MQEKYFHLIISLQHHNMWMLLRNSRQSKSERWPRILKRRSFWREKVEMSWDSVQRWRWHCGGKCIQWNLLINGVLEKFFDFFKLHILIATMPWNNNRFLDLVLTTPMKYRHLSNKYTFSFSKWSSYTQLNPWNEDTSLLRTLSSVPMVSILEGSTAGGEM